MGIPLFVSDMSFGALSEKAEIALAKGAELAGTVIRSGEGGMLPKEQADRLHAQTAVQPLSLIHI